MLDKATVESIAKDYPEEEDDIIFEVHGRVSTDGDLGKKDFLAIVKWKARRALGWARRNDPETIKLVSRWAFAAPIPGLRAYALTCLVGVGVRMASAILIAYDPDNYTVMDDRARATLETLGLNEPELSPSMSLDDWKTYGAYLTVCKRLARGLGVSLRILDRCLYLLNGRTPEQYFAQE
ncbi:MAG: hypothetical protein KAW89_10125 [Armatimonadetes bacterium]|nr:hypothetical protein [Armatimonadota bacterium]